MPTRIAPAINDFVNEMKKFPHSSDEFMSVTTDEANFNALCDEIESAANRTGLRQMTLPGDFQPRAYFKYQGTTFYCGEPVPYPRVVAAAPPAQEAKPASLKAVAKPKRDVLQVASEPAAGGRRALRRRHAG